MTPGGLGRTGGDGTPYWCHYLQATLGGVTLESDVSRALWLSPLPPPSLSPSLALYLQSHSSARSNVLSLESDVSHALLLSLAL